MVFLTSQEVLHSLPPATTLLESDWLSSTSGACGQREPLVFALGGRRTDFLICQSPRCRQCRGNSLSSVNESEVFLQKLYFSATNYFVFIAKLNLPKPFDYPGDTASQKGYGDLGFGNPLLHTLSPDRLLRYGDWILKTCDLPQPYPPPLINHVDRVRAHTDFTPAHKHRPFTESQK